MKCKLPDSFKESLDAHQVVFRIESGFAGLLSSRRACCEMPLADGGEGTVDVLLEASMVRSAGRGKRRIQSAANAFGLLPLVQQVDGKSVNTAQSRLPPGLDRLTVEERSPLQ
ncbi:glycerate kinase [Vibrio chagasii]|nr:glycerate kinase [Vibrio chagasii]